MLFVRLRMSSLMVAELSKLASEAVTTIVRPRLSSRFAACASMLDATILDVRKMHPESNDDNYANATSGLSLYVSSTSNY